MPCGCFGGGGKKKGSPQGSEAPLKPPKLPAEEPLNQQHVPPYTTQPEAQCRPESEKPFFSSENGPVDNGPGNGTVGNASINGSTSVTTPQSESQVTVDGGSNKSSGARSRAELYAKRREFFRPLYEVSLAGSNQRFTTPRSANTLPSRGKRGGGGGILIGDGSGYFTSDGRYVAGDAGGSREDNGRKYMGSGERLPCEVGRVDGYDNDQQFDDVGEDRSLERPHRPTSQPTGLAGQWDDLMGSELQDEFHQKHHQIVQHHQPHSGDVPSPPPPRPREVNPHFIEFQETHHKILHDPDSHSHPRHNDPELTQHLVESRLTELDKLHNEVQEHYEKRMKHGPVDVDSLVQKYTEERWRKMVELWESEGLVVEGGIVVVDDKGNVIERDMKADSDGGHVVREVTSQVDSVGDVCDTFIDRIEREGGKIVKVVERNREIEVDGDRISVVKHTEEILVEKIVEQLPAAVTTVVTPPTPQSEVTFDVDPLTELDAYEQNSNYGKFIEEEEEDAEETEHLLELNGDENFKNIRKVIERERISEEAEDLLENPSSYRVSPPPSPPPSSHAVLPQTCTPPPSPQREHRPTVDADTDLGSTCVTTIMEEDGTIVITKSSTPPPSPPLQATTE